MLQNSDDFSNEFDLLYNNIMSNLAPGLDLFEKGEFLTMALELLLLAYYRGTSPLGESFEKTEELRRYLDTLVITHDCIKSTATTDKTLQRGGKYHTIYSLPDGMWFIVYEEVKLTSTDTCQNNKIVDVLPVTHDDYSRLSRNPFKGITNNRVLRLNNSKDKVELISNDTVNTYTIRYIQLPTPIDLEDEDSYNNPCKLNPVTYRPIIQLAVQLAKLAWKS